MNAPLQTHDYTRKIDRSQSAPISAKRGEEDALGAYLARIGRGALLSADDEAALAAELRAGKQAVWLALFAQSGVIAGLVDQRALEDGPWTQLAAACLDAPDPLLRAELADALVDADPGMGLADRIAATVPSERRTHVRAAMAVVRRIRERFVGANLRLVAKTAMRYRGRGLPVSDLVQEGNLGLMKAVDRYDHRRGCRFSTYAMWWIKSTITRGLANHGRTIRVPTAIHHTYSRVSRACARFQLVEGRAATTEELASLLGESEAVIARAREAMVKPISLDAPFVDGGREAFGERVPDESADTFPDALDDDAALVRQALNALSPLEAEIVRHRFGLDDDKERTLQEIGDSNGLSRERIRQLQHRALGKLRRILRDTMR